MTDYRQTGSDATTITAASRAALTPEPVAISSFNTGPQALAQLPDPNRMDISNLIFATNTPEPRNPNAFAFFGESLTKPKTQSIFGNYG